MGIGPIVSSVSSITESLSQFVDKWLQPLIKGLPSYVKDTTDFINLIERTPFSKDCILASIDVSSLYTKIPHDEGKHAVIDTLKAMDNPDPYQPPLEIIGELVHIALNNNVFEFNDKFYLQIQGTAMDTKMSPDFADIFMGKLEPILKEHGIGHILIWKRFINGVFII